MDFVGAADKGCDDSRVSWASLKIDNEREREREIYIYIYIYEMAEDFVEHADSSWCFSLAMMMMICLSSC